MNKKVAVFTVLSVLALVVCVDTNAEAKQRSSSGSYTNSRGGSGTFQKNVTREPGHTQKNFTWSNDKGTGTRTTERTWDKTSGTGTYSSNTTTPGGKTISRSGMVTKNDDGSFTKQGTITGPQGHVTTVNKTAVKNADGSVTVNGQYVRDDGKSMTVNKTVVRGEDGDKTITRTLTNQDGETATHIVSRDREGDTITRNVTNTNFNGVTNSHTRTVTRDPGEAA